MILAKIYAWTLAIVILGFIAVILQDYFGWWALIPSFCLGGIFGMAMYAWLYILENK